MQTVLIGDRNGRKIGEVEADLGEITWMMNDVSSLKFTLAKHDEKMTEPILRYGNRVLIQFDNGLPNWGGMIDPPRAWDASTVTATVYSAERILADRITGRNRVFTDATIGYIFSKVIEEANFVEDTGISIGTIFQGGGQFSPDYHFERVMDIIRDSLCTRLSQYDYEIAGSESGSRIIFTANLYETRGTEKPNVVLIEGTNTGTINLTEQGAIANKWSLAGSGTDWNDSRLYAYIGDSDSARKYGLREKASIRNDVQVQSDLDAEAANALEDSKNPYNILELEALNLEPALFADYGLGDTIRVILHSYGFGGFDGLVRVESRAYNPKTGTCTLAVRQV